MTTLRPGAIASAVLSGSYALVALVIGSPFEFGVALALCAACWIAADFIARTTQRARPRRRQTPPPVQLRSVRRSSHVVVAGADSSHPASHAGAGLAA